MPLYVWETKSTSEDIGLGSSYWRRLSIDQQVSLYLQGAALLGYPCDGILYNVLRKPELEPKLATPVELRKYTKPTKKDPVSRLYANQRETDESPDEYGRRVLAAIVEEPQRYFQRGIIVRLEADVREAAADVWQVACNMRDARRLKIYPRNPDSCMQWSRACEFLPVCCGEQSIDDPVLFRKVESKHVELDVVRDREVLTQSSLRTYRACPRKYFYRYELLVRTLKEPEVLKTGKSLHRAIESHMKSCGDLQAAVAALDTDDPYQFAKESAMIRAYHAYWAKVDDVVGVEMEWSAPLLNPETGAASKTFVLAGRFDGLVRGERERLTGVASS